MIAPNPHPHRAFVDKDGNIVLPPADDVSAPARAEVESKPVEKSDDAAAPTWHLVEEVPAVQAHVSGIRKLTESALAEEWQEIEATVEELPHLMREFEEESESLFRRLKRILLEPVSLQGRTKQHHYNRGTLFIFDIIRFGGTFAGIFAVLFVALNFTSFYDIALGRITPLLQPPTIGSTGTTDDPQSPLLASVARQEKGQGLLNFLPQVGPPDNRLIIPKLGLNVPIVNPPTNALLRQDWAQVEQDIQSSLENGVVHYPGTANAGQAGNFFLTGHSSYYGWAQGKYKSVFARLSELNPGDEYWVYYGGDKHRYTVQSKKEVKPSDITVLDQPAGKRLSTLMTCTPVGTSLRRLIIVSEEVDLSTGIALKVGDRTERVATQKVQLQALPI